MKQATLSPAPAHPELKCALPLLAPALATGCIILAWLAWLAPDVATAWEWRRNMLMDVQWWRLWSCHLVHFSIYHALTDGAVLLLAGALSERLIGTRALALRLALAAALVLKCVAEARGWSAGVGGLPGGVKQP